MNKTQTYKNCSHFYEYLCSYLILRIHKQYFFVKFFSDIHSNKKFSLLFHFSATHGELTKKKTIKTFIDIKVDKICVNCLKNKLNIKKTTYQNVDRSPAIDYQYLFGAKCKRNNSIVSSLNKEILNLCIRC
jgi:hypothetical protein